jgi:hypothetical protein
VLQAAVSEAMDKLLHCRCVLPEHQIHLINQFRALVRKLMGDTWPHLQVASLANG